jgi:hypothetical protein
MGWLRVQAADIVGSYRATMLATCALEQNTDRVLLFPFQDITNARQGTLDSLLVYAQA